MCVRYKTTKSPCRHFTRSILRSQCSHFAFWWGRGVRQRSESAALVIRCAWSQSRLLFFLSLLFFLFFLSSFQQPLLAVDMWRLGTKRQDVGENLPPHPSAPDDESSRCRSGSPDVGDASYLLSRCLSPMIRLWLVTSFVVWHTFLDWLIYLYIFPPSGDGCLLLFSQVWSRQILRKFPIAEQLCSASSFLALYRSLISSLLFSAAG